MKHPYLYRIRISKTLESPEFTLGRGCAVILNLAPKSLIYFLREAYHRDKFCLRASPAEISFLLTFSGVTNTRNHPCIEAPKKITF